jgi:hypothetical protein
VQKTLVLNEIETENTPAQLKTKLSDDFKSMNGELRYGNDGATASFAAKWREE